MLSANFVKTLFFDQICRPFLTLSKHYRYKCKNNVYIMLTQCIYNVYKMLKQCLYKLIQISHRQHLNNVKKGLQI